MKNYEHLMDLFEEYDIDNYIAQRNSLYWNEIKFAISKLNKRAGGDSNKR
jgi:hypothetical protein